MEFTLRWVTLFSVGIVAIMLAGTVGTLRTTLSTVDFAAVFLLLMLSVGYILQSGIRNARSLDTPYW